MPEPTDITFFKTPAAFRRWLEKHHATRTELWVGYYKKDSGKAGMTWPESVDQALCFGWIDGIRKKVDAESYTNRFTPRTPRSIWSAVNTRRAEELVREGLMTPAGLTAFAARTAARSGLYSFEQRVVELPAPFVTRFKRNRAAWAFYQKQPAGYRKTSAWWVMSARKEETKKKRLETLIVDSAQGRPIPQFTRKKANTD